MKTRNSVAWRGGVCMAKIKNERRKKKRNGERDNGEAVINGVI